MYTTINNDSMIMDRAAYHVCVCVWDINHATEMINDVHTYTIYIQFTMSIQYERMEMHSAK